MDALIEKLQQYEQRYNQINDLLVSDDIISKPKEMTKLAKEQASIKQIVDAYNDLKAIDTLTKQGINFVPKSFRNGEWRMLKPLNFKRVSRSEIREKEIAKTLNRKNEKVKPNYKKKKTQAINRIKQKERQAYIRQKIKEEKKARYKANHKEY